jgi:hypothetical protein
MNVILIIKNSDKITNYVSLNLIHSLSLNSISIIFNRIKCKIKRKIKIKITNGYFSLLNKRNND